MEGERVLAVYERKILRKIYGPVKENDEENITNKMQKLILGLIYYCSTTPTCFGPLIEAIIRECKILECYKAFMAI
jgi:hypothetical protein